MPIADTEQKRVRMGQRVVLTNPNYPDMRFEGELIEGPTASLDGYHYTGSYRTWTVRDDAGHRHRSEGVIALA